MESKVGMNCFYTDTPGIGGKLKKYPEDFRVEEEIELPDLKDGEYTIAKVWSRNWETNRLVRKLAKTLGISRNDIAFAGTKDKRAITTQWMSFKVPPNDLEEVDIKDIRVTDIKESHRSLHIGAHYGNSFEIIIRDLDVDLDEGIGIVEETGELIKERGGFPNWFGIQRFGALRPITHLVGKYIVQGDFKRAVRTYVANPIEGEDQRCYQARKELEETWDFEKALNNYPKILSFERDIIKALNNEPENYTKALKKLPHNLLMMFIHAYQSYLFNMMICRRFERDMPLNDAVEGDIILPADKNGLPNKDTIVDVKSNNIEKCSNMVQQGKAYISAPLFGVRTRFSEGVQGEIEREVIDEEGLIREDFIVPEISSISSTGTRREIFAPVSNIKWNLENSGIKLSFSLNKGSYATTLLREFMKLPESDVLNYS